MVITGGVTMTENDVIKLLAEYGIFEIGFINNLKPLDIVFDINIQDFRTRSLDTIIDKLSLSPEDTINMYSISKLPKDIYSFRFEGQRLYFVNINNPSTTEYGFLAFLQTVFNVINSNIYTKF